MSDSNDNPPELTRPGIEEENGDIREDYYTSYINQILYKCSSHFNIQYKEIQYQDIIIEFLRITSFASSSKSSSSISSGISSNGLHSPCSPENRTGGSSLS